MRVLFLLFLLFGVCSCGINDGVDRGYIISHSNLEKEGLDKTQDK
jgi:hypothetical protein